ncbi:MAG: hypothetical protein LBD25_02895 [Coriobacteriales bacterium]|jgi:hypothetical protein|nr:hypothetical protein [Coriobacteriales bacterium]
MKHLFSAPRQGTGTTYLLLALAAWIGLAAEYPLSLLFETLFSLGTGDGTSVGGAEAPPAMLWAFASILWCALAVLLARVSRNRGFSIMAKRDAPDTRSLLLCVSLLAVLVVTHLFSWGAPRATLELDSYGPALFALRCVYHLSVALLAACLVAFAQHAAQLWGLSNRMPWGGLLAAVLWGAAALLIGEGVPGMLTAFLSAFLFGVVYVLAWQNMRVAYPFIALLVIL